MYVFYKKRQAEIKPGCQSELSVWLGSIKKGIYVSFTSMSPSVMLDQPSENSRKCRKMTLLVFA